MLVLYSNPMCISYLTSLCALLASYCQLQLKSTSSIEVEGCSLSMAVVQGEDYVMRKAEPLYRHALPDAVSLR
jgi:hypothetical protein